ncbi:hypothetical protein, partial [Clostridium sp.]|uniref:hypothetical protein n=1 Tax=Clostridium sp. TaxID=1506 RepID=UPI0028409694
EEDEFGKMSYGYFITLIDHIKTYINKTFKKEKSNSLNVSTLCNFWEKRKIITSKSKSKKSSGKMVLAKMSHSTESDDFEMIQIGWAMSRLVPVKNIEISDIFRDSISDIYVKEFMLFFQPSKYQKVKSYSAGTDKHNDCFYNCILQAHNFDKEMLPKKIREPHKLKSVFGYERDEKIPLDDPALLIECESLLKCSFQIVGDYQYSSKIIKHKNILLQYKDEHVKLLCNDEKKNTKGLHFKEVKPNEVIMYCFEKNTFQKDSKIKIYKDSKTEIVTEEQRNEMKESNKYIMVKCEPNDNLAKQYARYIKKADYFKDKTKGLINYYKSSYEALLSLDLWRAKSVHCAKHEEIQLWEQFPLRQALLGGCHYAEAGKHKNCIDYDMNIMYLHYMSSPKFSFPTKQGTLQYLSTKELNDIGFFKFGLYKCTIQE